jgi:hypothetical protein
MIIRSCSLLSTASISSQRFQGPRAAKALLRAAVNSNRWGQTLSYAVVFTFQCEVPYFQFLILRRITGVAAKVEKENVKEALKV